MGSNCFELTVLAEDKISTSRICSRRGSAVQETAVIGSHLISLRRISFSRHSVVPRAAPWSSRWLSLRVMMSDELAGDGIAVVAICKIS